MHERDGEDDEIAGDMGRKEFGDTQECRRIDIAGDEGEQNAAAKRDRDFAWRRLRVTHADMTQRARNVKVTALAGETRA